jgi:hypothetical protein
VTGRERLAATAGLCAAAARIARSCHSPVDKAMCNAGRRAPRAATKRCAVLQGTSNVLMLRVSAPSAAQLVNNAVKMV